MIFINFSAKINNANFRNLVWRHVFVDFLKIRKSKNLTKKQEVEKNFFNFFSIYRIIQL